MPTVNMENLTAFLAHILTWLKTNILIWENLIQLVVILILLAGSYLLARGIRPLLTRALSRFFESNRLARSLFATLLNQLPGIHLIVLLWIALLVYAQLEMQALVIDLVLTLAVAWVVIKLASSVILDRFWSLTVSVAAWTLAALSILDILTPMLAFLDGLGFDIGEVHISVLSLLKAALLLLIALRLGHWASGYFDRQLHRIPQLNASARVLISKTVSGLLYFIIVLAVLNSIGIDFTALAVFGGALGVGIGFGLQKVVSNLISGIILLSDRSIKPGDVIQIGNIYGWISSLKGRFVSVVTRDGHEYLIPNEDLITQQVINWSYSDPMVRLRIPFGVSYKSDPHQVRDLVLEAVKQMPRILDHPKPICLMSGFGDSSVDLELRVWINDPKNGIGNIKSDILFKIWDVLKENGIEIPFPQRDLHIKRDLVD